MNNDELFETYCEVNMNNYNDDDVIELNQWSYQAIDHMREQSTRITELVANLQTQRREYLALQAQLADAQRDAWQPIETAPKEGEFLVFMPTNRTPIQHCSAHKNVTIIGNCFAFDLPKPTHWMPLPKMPVMQPNGAAMTTTPNLSSEDIMVWPDDMLGSTWCYRDELEEMNHMSDDYITLYVGSKAWIKHVESQ